MIIIKNVKSTSDFLKIIPKAARKNIEFRSQLHSQLARDRGMRNVFVDLCREDPKIAFKTMLWTFNPRQEQTTSKGLPFITWENEDEAIDSIVCAMRNGGDRLINKSREVGATWIVLGCGFLEWLFMPETTGLLTSRKEEYVDKRGNPDCLFWKLDYMLKRLPEWSIPAFDRTHLHLKNLWNESVIDGESTNVDVGRGGRRQWVMCDEFGAVPAVEAESIQRALSDTTSCRLFNSTPSTMNHPFAKLRFSGKIPVIIMPWWKHPFKRKGLYTSPDLDVISIEDIGYYRQLCPEVFTKIENRELVKASDLQKELLVKVSKKNSKVNIIFVADGGRPGRAPWRSPWYDKEEKRRTRQDLAQNIDMDYIGAGDMFFDAQVCQQIRTNTVKGPKFTGEISYQLDKNGKIKKSVFNLDFGRRRFKWWGELKNDYQGRLRPLQEHNYIIACDISMGSGATNSVAGVYDVNTHEKVGIFVCPYTPPESFADQALAICKWVGGANKPYLIWEANGPGNAFDKRVLWHGYSFVYTLTNERIPYRPRAKKRGWYSSIRTKADLLCELRGALSEGLNPRPKHKALIIHDEESVSEYETYNFLENGDIGPSGFADLESGARFAHGDRVIADGLAVLAFSEQPRAAKSEKAKAHPGSYAWRRRNYLDSKKRTKDEWGEKRASINVY